MVWWLAWLLGCPSDGTAPAGPGARILSTAQAPRGSVRLEVLADEAACATVDAITGCLPTMDPATGTAAFSLRLAHPDGSLLRRPLAASDLRLVTGGAPPEAPRRVDGRGLAPAPELFVLLVDSTGPRPLSALVDAMVLPATVEALFGESSSRLVVPLQFRDGVAGIDGDRPAVVTSRSDWDDRVRRFRTSMRHPRDAPRAVEWAATDLLELPEVQSHLARDHVTTTMVLISGRSIEADRIEAVTRVLDEAAVRLPGLVVHTVGVGRQAAAWSAVSDAHGGSSTVSLDPAELAGAIAGVPRMVPRWHRVEARAHVAPDGRPASIEVTMPREGASTSFVIAPAVRRSRTGPWRPLVIGLGLAAAVGLIGWLRTRRASQPQ